MGGGGGDSGMARPVKVKRGLGLGMVNELTCLLKFMTPSSASSAKVV